MKVCLLGASGSIGNQTLDVIESNKDDFTLVSFAVGKNDSIIPSILKKHSSVTHVYLINNKKAKELAEVYPDVTFLSDEHDLENIISLSNAEMVVNALVGFSGLLPSIRALKENKLLALANKESLIVGGEIINSLLKEGKGKLYPIDSEHSAIWKCLKVNDKNIKKVIITASGGSFRNLNREQLINVTPNDALKHPTWNMGAKITIDSATMMNKTFELIEAYYLFKINDKKLEIILHDESRLHSAICYKDGTYRGELNDPDMKNPIKFALYEGNIPFETVSFNNFDELENCHFHEFSISRYPLVDLAKTVIQKRGNLGAIINGSNEIAVNAFLNNEISFLGIEKVVLDTLKEIKYQKEVNLDDLLRYDSLSREIATKLIRKGNY